MYFFFLLTGSVTLHFKKFVDIAFRLPEEDGPPPVPEPVGATVVAALIATVAGVLEEDGPVSTDGSLEALGSVVSSPADVLGSDPSSGNKGEAKAQTASNPRLLVMVGRLASYLDMGAIVATLLVITPSLVFAPPLQVL